MTVHIGDDTGNITSITNFAHKQQFIKVQQPNNRSSNSSKQINVQLNSKPSNMLKN
jgi:hypothetical protein